LSFRGRVNRKFCSAKWALAQKQGQRAGREISIRPDARRAGALPPGPVLMTTYIKTSETNRYVTLARDVDLRTIVWAAMRLRPFRRANRGH
jgi:hypothetical protein